jgi:hypothetical protein
LTSWKNKLPPRCDRKVFGLVDHEQGGPYEEADPFSERAFALGLGQLGDQIGERNRSGRTAGSGLEAIMFRQRQQRGIKKMWP